MTKIRSSPTLYSTVHTLGLVAADATDAPDTTTVPQMAAIARLATAERSLIDFPPLEHRIEMKSYRGETFPDTVHANDPGAHWAPGSLIAYSA